MFKFQSDPTRFLYRIELNGETLISLSLRYLVEDRQRLLNEYAEYVDLDAKQLVLKYAGKCMEVEI
jgi:hypothetical protein